MISSSRLESQPPKIVPYNNNTSTFIFELPEGTASLLPVASCVVVKSDNLKDAKDKPVIRPYTPVSPSDTPGELAFLIKKYDTGVASKFIHEMKPGDKLAVKGPIPKFPYKGPSARSRRVLLTHHQ